MCGIVIAPQSVNIAEQVSRIKSRGPDDFVAILREGYAFAFWRLAIVALGEQGRQPYEDDEVIVVFNGELYNWDRSFGSEVKWLAHLAKSASDFAMLLNGQFFIVVYYKRARKFVFFRDPLGIIPGYYQPTNEGIMLSSELSADFACFEVEPGLVYTYWASTGDGAPVMYPYHMPMIGDIPFNHQEYAQVLGLAVSRIILHSDVPVSLALGGLDSMILLLMAIRWGHRPSEVFTVGFSEESADIRFAKMFAQWLGFQLHTIQVSPEQIKEAIPIISARMGEDILQNSVKLIGALRNYFVAKHASNKVILCGDGADELFYGYNTFERTSPITLPFQGLQSLRSMHQINLDRVDLMGMLFSREYRPIYLEKHHMAWVLQRCRHAGKQELREFAQYIGIPSAFTTRPKYGNDEPAIKEMVRQMQSGGSE